MTATTREETPVAIEGGGVELRMTEVGGDMTAAFVRFPQGHGHDGRGEGTAG